MSAVIVAAAGAGVGIEGPEEEGRMAMSSSKKGHAIQTWRPGKIPGLVPRHENPCVHALQTFRDGSSSPGSFGNKVLITSALIQPHAACVGIMDLPGTDPSPLVRSQMCAPFS